MYKNSDSNYTLDRLAKSLSSPEKINILGEIWQKKYTEELKYKLYKSIESKKDSAHPLKIVLSLVDDNFISKWCIHPEAACALTQYRFGSSSQMNALSKAFTETISCTKNHGFEYDNVARGVKTTNFKLGILGGISLDVLGSFEFSPVENCYGKLSLVKNKDLVIDKVLMALNSLQRIDINAHEFIVKNNILLCLREDVEAKNSYSSSSYSGYPGLTLLANCDLERISHLRIIDSLYHEAIHALIYYFEEMFEPLLKIKPSSTKYIISPWSGRSLKLNQFVQACFVWWGLLSFWSSVSLSDENLSNDVYFLKKRAQSGFDENIITILENSGLYSCVSESCICGLNEIQSLYDLIFAMDKIPLDCVESSIRLINGNTQ